jgi:hypothetical protein
LYEVAQSSNEFSSHVAERMKSRTREASSTIAADWKAGSLTTFFWSSALEVGLVADVNLLACSNVFGGDTRDCLADNGGV